MSLAEQHMPHETGISLTELRKQQIISLVSDFTTETTPGQASKIERFDAHFPLDTTVNVTFLPGSSFADTIMVSNRLKQEGFLPVPHLAARSFKSHDHFEDSLAELASATGLSEVLIIAGGVDKPVGPFDNSMELLETGLLQKYGVRKIGIAGHPEGSPDIPASDILSALQFKHAYARAHDLEMYIATQFCFELDPIRSWEKNLRHMGIDLPVRIGIPGPATLKALLNYARLCGVGPSMRFLTRQARNISKLMTISAPVNLVTELAAYKAEEPDCLIDRLHIYPLGGLGRAGNWMTALQQGEFEVHPDGTGFTITAD